MSLPLDDTLDYEVSQESRVVPGMRVLVPCAGRQVVGVVVAERVEGAARRSGEARSVIEVLDSAPVLPESLLKVLLRAARDALCPPGLALAAALPPGTAPRIERRVQLQEAGRQALARGEARGSLREVLRALERGAPTEVQFRRRFEEAGASLEQLERVGWVKRELTRTEPRVRVRTQRVYRVDPSFDPGQARVQLGKARRQLELYEQLLHGPQLHVWRTPQGRTGAAFRGPSNAIPDIRICPGNSPETVRNPVPTFRNTARPGRNSAGFPA